MGQSSTTSSVTLDEQAMHAVVLADDSTDTWMWGGCGCGEIDHPEHGHGIPVVDGCCVQCGEPIHDAARCPCSRCDLVRLDELRTRQPRPPAPLQLDSETYELVLDRNQALAAIGEELADLPETVAEIIRSGIVTRGAVAVPRKSADRDGPAPSGSGIVLGDLWKDGKPPARAKPTGGDLCMVQPVDPKEAPYGLLMRHKRHAIIGDYEVGKTHVLATMAIQCALEDPTLPICFLDFADDLESIHWRLIDLGMDEQLARRITYATSLTEADAQPADCLLLVDEFTGAITEAGLNQNSMSDVETIWQRLHGPDRTRTVVAADHRRKEAEDRRDFASGSSFKMAVVNGFAYFLENQAIAERNLPMNIPLRLVKSKASPSLRTRGLRNPKKPGEIWIANLSIMIDPEGWATDQWAYRPMEALPASRRGQTSSRRRDNRMDKLVDWSRLTVGEAASASDASRYLGVSKNTAAGYLRDLAADGLLTVETGANRTKLYRLPDADVIDLNPQ